MAQLRPLGQCNGWRREGCFDTSSVLYEVDVGKKIMQGLCVVAQLAEQKILSMKNSADSLRPSCVYDRFYNTKELMTC